MIKTFINVNWQFEGLHSYPNAPEDVSFLRNRHRHLFKCSVKIQVFHNERELEYFQVQSILKAHFFDRSYNDHSCEQIAISILDFLKVIFYQREIIIEVSEDGENSSIVEYKPI